MPAAKTAIERAKVVTPRRIQAVLDWAQQLATGTGAFALKPGIKTLALTTGRKGPGLTGARMFGHQVVPSLRLKNPQVSVLVRPSEKDSKLVVQLDDSTTKEHNLFNMSKADILRLVKSEYESPSK